MPNNIFNQFWYLFYTLGYSPILLLFIYLFVYLFLLLLLKLFSLWPLGTLSVGSCAPLTFPIIVGFLRSSILLAGTRRHFRLHLAYFLPQF
jgi:hypothetical protein